MIESLVNVHIGEVKTGTDTQQLHTILGSCIGIAFLWQKRGVYGLAHCLLPKAPINILQEQGKKSKNKEQVNKARYVDQAIDSLTRAMSITDFRDIRAVVAGGANMTQPDCKHPEKLVGALNAASAIEGLTSRKIVIVQSDTGGNLGRKMTIFCDSGSYDVASIPRPQSN